MKPVAPPESHLKNYPKLPFQCRGGCGAVAVIEDATIVEASEQLGRDGWAYVYVADGGTSPLYVFACGKCAKAPHEKAAA